MTATDSDFAALAGAEQWPERIGPQAVRLFHGRGDCYPGFEFLTVDYFAPVLWVVLYKRVEPALWDSVSTVLRDTLGGHCQVAAVQHRYDRDAPLELLWGELPVSPIAREGQLAFQLTLGGRQNPGYFMDMRPARQWLAQRAQGKRILNLFAYTCAFSVAAMSAGASSVVNIDMSRSAMRQGRDNHRLNDLDGKESTTFLSHDIFRSWGKLRRPGPYDVIICDPPSRQAGSFDAEKDYPRLVRRLSDMLAPQGSVLACLNAPYLGEAFLREVLAANAPDLEFVERLPARADFPDRDPDRALKVLHFQRR